VSRLRRQCRKHFVQGNRGAGFINGSIQVLPVALHPHIGLVHSSAGTTGCLRVRGSYLSTQRLSVAWSPPTPCFSVISSSWRSLIGYDTYYTGDHLCRLEERRRCGHVVALAEHPVDQRTGARTRVGIIRVRNLDCERVLESSSPLSNWGKQG
jgi:hypothetical protein